MSNTYLVFEDAHGDKIRVRADSILAYKREPGSQFLKIETSYEFLQVQCSPEDLDRALTESYFMLKPVIKSDENT